MNNEVWKPYPEFPWIQGSSLGGVRTIGRYVKHWRGGKRLIKGHILKQHPDKDGYLRVGFGENGKKFCIPVHRIIASCFLPNPDNLPQVNHLDCDRTNNHLNNLEWCTGEYNIEYREKHERALNRPLWAFNLKTGKKLHFRSQGEAARELGLYRESISEVIKGKRNQTGGYYFTEDESKINKDKLSKIIIKDTSKRPIIAINLETQETLQFHSQHEAARQLGLSVGNIGNVIAGRYKYTGGYWFTNADDNAVESTRSKFGELVADKVEQLIEQQWLHDFINEMQPA